MRATQKENKFTEKDKLKELREEMKTKFASDATEAELQATHAKIKELRDKKAESRFKKLLSIRKVLTVEQRKKFQELHMKTRKKDKKKSQK